MAEKLKNIINSKSIKNPNNYDFSTYYYFHDSHDDIIAIEKEIITERDLNIIELFAKRIVNYEILPREKKYYEFIFNDDDNKNMDDMDQLKFKYYFFYIDVELDFDNETYFRELLTQVFGSNTLLLKHKDVYVVLAFDNEEVDIKELLDSISLDFLFNVRSYEGEIIELTKETAKSIMKQANLFSVVAQKANFDVVLEKDLYHLVVMNDILPDTKKILKEVVLGKYINDYEMMTILMEFFTCNMNVSQAAKKLYMHRNTVQNKMDKFIKETGYNVREFKDAMLVYFSISTCYA